MAAREAGLTKATKVARIVCKAGARIRHAEVAKRIFIHPAGKFNFGMGEGHKATAIRLNRSIDAARRATKRAMADIFLA